MIKKYFFLLLFSISLIGFSCTPGANDPLEDHLQAYNWKVTYLWYLGQERTTELSPYIFDFVNVSLVTATRPDSTFNGTWSRSNASQENPKIILDFGSHQKLKMLNYEWHQSERNNERIAFHAPTDDNEVIFERVP